MAKFTDLPREIRDQIYKLLLTVGAELIAHPAYFEKPTNFKAEGVIRPAVALLSVNKQISDEVATVFYGSDTWRIPKHDRPSFKTGIYRIYGHLFRHITIHLDRRDTDEFYTTWRVEHIYESFASLTMVERMRYTHDDRSDSLSRSMSIRGSLVVDYMSHIQSLTLVVDNLYCPSGCCRLDTIKTLYEDFLLMFDPEPKGMFWQATCPQSLKDVRVTGLRSQAEKDLVYGEWGFKGAAVEQDTA